VCDRRGLSDLSPAEIEENILCCSSSKVLLVLEGWICARKVLNGALIITIKRLEETCEDPTLSFVHATRSPALTTAAFRPAYSVGPVLETVSTE
jgi:hypothetical protein